MPRVEIADIGERNELLEPVRRTPRDGFEHKADVVADVVAAEYRASEPPGGVVENRQPLRARMPCAAPKLVGPIAGRAPEEQGKFALASLDQVDRKMAGALGHPVGVIAFREPHQEPRREDAHLTGEPDEAASRLIACAVVTTYIG